MSQRHSLPSPEQEDAKEQTREEEFLQLAVRKRKHDLIVEREARIQLAADGWEEPGVEDAAGLLALYPDYIVGDFIEHGTVGSLVGSWGTGKTFVAIDLAASASLGISWQGHEVSQAVNTLYVAAEGGGGIGRRRKAWEKHHDLELPAEGLLFIRKAVPIAADIGRDFLAGIINKYQIGFLVIDTLARSITGLDESGALDMGKVIETLYYLRDCRDDGEPVTILFVHHHGKDTSRGARGSSRLTADVDYSYEIEDKGSHFEMTCSKVKDGEKPSPFLFRLSQTEITSDDKQDRRPMMSCVIEPVTDGLPPAAPTNRDRVLKATTTDWETTSDIAERAGFSQKSRTTVSGILSQLAKEGVTERMIHGDKKTVLYRRKTR